MFYSCLQTLNKHWCPNVIVSPAHKSKKIKSSNAYMHPVVQIRKFKNVSVCNSCKKDIISSSNI